MKRRTTLAALALGLCLALLPAAARAADASTTISGTWGTLQWTCHTDTGVLDITGSGPMPDTPLPDEARDNARSLRIGSGITTISAGAFQNMDLASVTIPGTVTAIGERAFAGNDSLKSVVIPGTVSTIGDSAFADNSTLERVAIQEGVSSIGDSAFEGNSSLTVLTIPASVKTIGKWAFNRCSGLTSVTIPGHNVQIGSEAFRSCANLASVTFEGNVDSIGKRAFASSPKLASVTVNGNVGEICEETFSFCSALASVKITGKADSIGMNAFYSCRALTSIGIGGDVGVIGEAAFQDCDALTGVTFQNIGAIGKNAFEDCGALERFTVEGSVGTIGETAFRLCKKLTGFTVKGDVGSVKMGVFELCNALTSLTFSGDVGTFGDGTIGICHNLKSVTFEGGVDAIGKEAFTHCDRLTEVIIKGTVGNIEQSGFANCSRLRTFEVAQGAGVIGANAFEGCSALTRVAIPDGITEVKDRAFANCGSLTTLYLPTSVKTVGRSLFYYSEDVIKDVYYGGKWADMTGTISQNSDGLPVLHENARGLPGMDADSTTTLNQRISDGRGAGRTDIFLTQDFDLGGTLEIPEDSAVVLDLKGHTLTSTSTPAIRVLGSLTVLDSTADPEPVVNGGRTVTYASGFIDAQAAGPDGSDGAAILVQGSGSFTLESGTLKSTGRGLLVWGREDEEGDIPYEELSARVTGGYVDAQASAAIVRGAEASLRVDGGVLLSRDNAVLAGVPGSVIPGGWTDIAVWGGTLISQSATPGYLPCGIYCPQDGYLRIYGGTIYAEGGVGIVLRGGSTSMGRHYGQDPMDIHVSGSGRGRVGRDSGGIELEAGHRVVLDQKSGYDGANDIRYTVREELLEQWPALIPDACYPAGGFEVKTKARGGGVEYSFGPADIYTVTFDHNGGVGGVTTQETNTDQRIEHWPVPKRDGYVFRGWHEAKNSLNPYASIGETRQFEEDTTLYASWTPEGAHLIVFYYIDYSPVPSVALYSIKVTDTGGVLTGWPEDPTRDDGVTFTGWFTAGEGGEEYLPGQQTYSFTEDTKIYAHWTSGPPGGPYTITFDSNGGEGGSTTQQTDVYGKLPELPGGPARAGYVFLGWSQAQNSGYLVSKGATFRQDSTLYAWWMPEDGYAVSFDRNDGSGAAPETRHTNRSAQVDPWPEAPKREGYSFLGWFTARQDGVKMDSGHIFYADTVLYACWRGEGETPAYTVTFDPNGGEGEAAVRTTGADGILSELPDGPARSGYTFTGWYTNTSGGEAITTATVFRQHTTVYARWSKEGEEPPEGGYTVTFDPNGGAGTAATRTTGADGTLGELPGGPARSGYTFTGWYTAVSGGEQVTTATVFKQNTTVYARWSAASGSTPDPIRYPIYTPGRTTGGSLWVSHSSAESGARITLELSPRSNYDLDWVTVTNCRTGRELRLTARSGGDYTFTMPAAPVEVEVRFYKYTGSSSFSAAESKPASAAPAAPAKPVQWYYSGGRICHVTDGLAPLNAPLTRDMLISVLYNLDSASSGEPAFWATEHGIVPDIYRSLLWGVDQPIRREQTAMVLLCYARHRGCNTTRIADITGCADYGQIRPVARPAMAWAQASGILTASPDNVLAPRDTLNCGQANAMLAHYVSSVLGGR